MRSAGWVCAALFFAACGGRALTVDPTTGASIDARADVPASIAGAGGSTDSAGASGSTETAGASGTAGAGATAGGAGGSPGGGTSGAGGASAGTTGAGGVGGEAGRPGTPDLKPIGASCTRFPECVSGVCASGVCCRTACPGQCSTCAATGTVGACTPLAVGTVCGAATCAGNVFVTPSTCNGGGTCLPGQRQNCAPYACDSSGASCRTVCASSADCAGVPCTGNVCRRSFTAICSTDSECVSGFCTDGLCCDARCRGPCVSCALASSYGVCAPVARGGPDLHGLCVDLGPGSCGTDGRCDGAGACARYPDAGTCP